MKKSIDILVSIQNQALKTYLIGCVVRYEQEAWYTRNVSQVVNQEDPELTQAMDHVQMTQLCCDDAWLARQTHYGVAGAMERQIEYLGGTLLPNTESRIQKMNGQGITQESYVIDNWFGTTNADSEHIDTENKGDEIIKAEMFRDQLVKRMRTAAIILVVHMKAT